MLRILVFISGIIWFLSLGEIPEELEAELGFGDVNKNGTLNGLAGLNETVDGSISYATPPRPLDEPVLDEFM